MWKTLGSTAVGIAVLKQAHREEPMKSCGRAGYWSESDVSAAVEAMFTHPRYILLGTAGRAVPSANPVPAPCPRPVSRPWPSPPPPAFLHLLKVVAADEKEAGLRATLNLGHTFGHAIEVLAVSVTSVSTGFCWPHVAASNEPRASRLLADPAWPSVRRAVGSRHTMRDGPAQKMGSARRAMYPPGLLKVFRSIG